MGGTPTNEDTIFKIVQAFLKDPPIIVWGSGATISFGLPSVCDLNKALGLQIKDFDKTNNNLEIELGKDKYQEKIPEIKKIIWDKVNDADISALERIISAEMSEFNGIKSLIEKFIEVHPKVVNIVTTNYDRVLEYIMSYYNIPHTDGFNGKILSTFDIDNFKNKCIVNLIKVHGSLNWFNVKGEVRFLPCTSEKENPQIIVPNKNKYQEILNNPHRELIPKADYLIAYAKSFLAVGFGFNDKHLTPEIKKKVKNGTPIVLIAKKISANSYKELENAQSYMFFEEVEKRKTRVIYKENNQTSKTEVELEGDLWQLNNFMEIL